MTRPTEGWSQPDRRGHVRFTKHNASFTDNPPKRDDFECYFVGRHGTNYTTWAYRPVKEKL